MTKIEKLGNLIGMTAEEVIQNIDNGMIDILLTLNEKGYLTCQCCEGHLRNDSTWSAYIGFLFPYKFSFYPIHLYTKNKRKYFYWGGVGEEERQNALKEILAWANSLPMHEPVYEYYYSLIGTNKRSHKSKILAVSNDYEDIKCRMNQSDIIKYDTEIRISNKRLIG